ncbi:MAG: hypothetical protein A3G84_02605 [Chloroflexi bacterium RIFCSPLOWO2_12_FULL_71_12]|nr:MAG: hypothetical protein A3G84_02605 [Chloroflexi bacterium RIFCSPLOWO2_12_FULL_71_12]
MERSGGRDPRRRGKLEVTALARTLGSRAAEIYRARVVLGGQQETAGQVERRQRHGGREAHDP